MTTPLYTNIAINKFTIVMLFTRRFVQGQVSLPEKNNQRCCPERSDAFREWHGHKRPGAGGGDKRWIHRDACGVALSGADFCFCLQVVSQVCNRILNGML